MCGRVARRFFAPGLHSSQGLVAVEKREQLRGGHSRRLAGHGFLPAAGFSHGIKRFFLARHKSIPTGSRYAPDVSLSEQLAGGHLEFLVKVTTDDRGIEVERGNSHEREKEVCLSLHSRAAAIH